MSGEYHAVFKGRGMNFSEVREYQIGDDVRTIDWNVSARTGRPHIKFFEEERELVVVLLCDVSSSSLFGSGYALKMEVAAELAAVLAFSAIKNNDKVGLLLFTDRVEKFVAPRKGRSHILRILRELITFEPQRSGTSLNVALEYLLNVLKKRAIVFLISDFIDDEYMKPLRVCARKHDLLALHLVDPREFVWPDAGLVKLHDAESGKSLWIDSSSREGKRALFAEFRRWQDTVKQTMQRSGADYMPVTISEDYVRSLVTMFKRRELRR
ncbi:MAG: DUF58 domain-containing protein [bacterium]|nr:DUF58 domain-containing protein [bacterium]